MRATTQERIGFIGLGVMGQPMALTLIKAGTELLVWNRSADKCVPLQAAGAEVAARPEEVFEKVTIVILMMASEAALDAVLGRETDGFSANVCGHTLIHMGTVSPDYSRRLDAEIRAAGGSYVEAPVSGSRKPTEAGELVAMLAGDPQIVDGVRPYLEPMCQQMEMCGAVPNALLMKLATNAFLIPLLTGLAEAFNFADRHGLDKDKLVSILNGGQMASPISQIKAQKLAAGDFGVQAAVSDVLKNNRFVVEAAQAAGFASPLLETCLGLFTEAEALGVGQDDVIAVLRAIEARSKA